MSPLTEESLLQISNFGKIFLKAYDDTKPIQTKNRNLIICGMGGSAIAGDYIKALSNLNKSKNQVIIMRDYDVPFFLNKDWIALVISYSGNTEETLSMLSGLQKLEVETHVISSGGKLDIIAKENKLNFIKIPSGFPPRFALPLILGTAYRLLEMVVNLENISEDMRSKITSFDNLEESSLLKQISDSLMSSTAIILSDYTYAPLSLRFRCQLNENSKSMAHNYILPEFSHNAIVGLENLKHTNYCLIIIRRGNLENNRIKIQRNFIETYAKRKNIDTFSINSDYDKTLIQLLDITRQLDYVSYIIALRSNIDPIVVESIDELKQNLDNN